MSDLTNESVQECVHFKKQYERLVQELVQCRKSIPQSQQDVADWLKVDRRKIIAFEKAEKYDIELMLKYARIMTVEINLLFEVN